MTSVHPSGDPRIRHKTVATLAARFTVRYAARPPAPSGPPDHEWVPLSGPRAVRGVTALREMLRDDVDLISLHDPELVPAGLLSRRLRQVPVVFDMHEDYEIRAIHADGHGEPHATPRGTIARRLVELADRHLTVTLAEPGYQRSLSTPRPVLPNHPIAALLPGPRPAEPDGRVVYVGDVTAHRGMHVLLRAASLMEPRPPVVMVGRCAADLRRRLDAQAAAAGVPLTLTGWLPHAEAMAMAAGATVAVCPLLDLPTYRESLPTKVLEYLGVGVPVVASDLPGTASVVAGLPGVTLVPPADPWALADAIAGASDPAARAAAQAGVDRLLTTFAWPGEQLLAIYQELLEAFAT